MTTRNSYVQRVHDDTQRALADLRGQNERMRLQIAALESDRGRLQHEKLRLQEQLITAREEMSSRQEEHTALVRRLTEVESENERVAAQFLDIEGQNTNLANLYVASHQLRSSVRRAEIMSAIKEIIINLVGCEDFAIFERAGGEERLELAGSFDQSRPAMSSVRFGDGIIGTVAATGEAYIAADERSRFSGVTACIPMTVDGAVTGVITLFTLLPQKSNILGALDHELFNLLAAQAGVALYCAALHEGVQRTTAQ